MPALTVEEARTRAATLTVRSYEIAFDLTVGDEVFRAVSTIRFSATDERTFVDVKPQELAAVTLNGRSVDTRGLDDGRLWLDGLQADNELVVDAVMRYSADGEGLQRSVDAGDGRVYLYGMSSLESAPRYFACFDQPDLKASYTMTVKCPDEWIVLGNGAAIRTAPGRWELEETKPLSTYFVTLVAGPYHVIKNEHDGIPLSLACRQSLKEHLEKDKDDLFTVTAQAFDEYHRLFGYRYPFGEYHQVFVPDFNLGAMENPGCVTFADSLVFRSTVTDAERSLRARIVVHEMAHMWFGDAVTMKWWNDLWLNESFAEYMANRVSHDVTDHQGHWIDFAYVRKWWGLQADQRTSTHPVAAEPGKDARQSLDDFDGISYAKGAAVLKQLAAYLGDEVFLKGVNAHIDAHEFGNADLHEFIAKLTEAGAEDLPNWSEQWLRTAGLDTISAERTATGIRLHRSTPADHPANRPHKLTVGAYDESGRATSVQVLLDQEVVDVDLDPLAAVIVPDAADDTWAKIRLDATSLANLPAVLPKIADGTTRAVIWNSIRDAVTDAELDPRQALAILLEAIQSEDSDIAVGSLLRWLEDRLLGAYLPQDPYRGQAAAALTARLAETPAGSSLQLAITRGLVATTDDAKLLQCWLDGSDVPEGLQVDTDFRWSLVLRLIQLGAYGKEEVEAELAEDRSTEGAVQAARCLAATADGREAAWQRIMTDGSVGVSELFATCEGFWDPAQAELTAPYVERYFTEIAHTGEIRAGMAVAMTVARIFPRFAVDEAAVRQAEALIADETVAPSIRRTSADQTDDLRRALAVRRTYGLD
ncbi:aminopeptidase N [Streptomyces sp. SID13031]|uniref:aminopeptidase N n=1 Tax=Streptomyces sp. SID13031 TaxID=2706046 RepID=UPI0013C8EAB0|nr:aminopeptidase N [Streptomyces sp. SID13031]NEA31481.1 aminopeptidase N [Streptomyces sp. SID13031]